MTPFELHEEAMRYSFLAKQERAAGREDEALNNYEVASNLESEAADFYFDRHDLEPTRSILIRSAAFLNLKAGIIERAEKYIFFGIVNTTDALLKEQLYDALELCLSFKNLSRIKISGNVEYIFNLRKKSVLYVLEPNTPEFGRAVSLSMISEFSDHYEHSLKGYSKSEFKNFFTQNYPDSNKEEIALTEFQKTIQPVVANASFGSFKFSLALDYLVRPGESPDFKVLKSNMLIKYHEEIFKNDINEKTIENYQIKYTSDEIDEIFRPIFKMRSINAPYKISYYDRETLRKTLVSRTKNIQKAKLLPVKRFTTDDIGFLENIIMHTRETATGEALRSTILKKQFKSYSFDHPTNVIEPKGMKSIILNEDILITVEFDSEKGFTFSYEDLDISVDAKTYDEGLNQFYISFLNLIKEIGSKDELTDEERNLWNVISRLVNNPKAIS